MQQPEQKEAAAEELEKVLKEVALVWLLLPTYEQLQSNYVPCELRKREIIQNGSRH